MLCAGLCSGSWMTTRLVRSRLIAYNGSPVPPERQRGVKLASTGELTAVEIRKSRLPLTHRCPTPRGIAPPHEPLIEIRPRSSGGGRTLLPRGRPAPLCSSAVGSAGRDVIGIADKSMRQSLYPTVGGRDQRFVSSRSFSASIRAALRRSASLSTETAVGCRAAANE
jgi:hypothetical protein